MNNEHTILLVDDAAENLMILTEILNQYHTITATSAEEAIYFAKKSAKPDLILLDIIMPGMNGFDACKQLKEDPETNEIPIIFISSDSELKSVVKGFQIGAQDYVTKPFEPAELLARVNTHLELVDGKKKLKELNLHLESVVRKRTKNLNEAYEKLRDANRQLSQLDTAKSEFVQIISHEIRTPLNGIINGLQLVKESEASDEVLDYIDILDESVLRLEKFSETAICISVLKSKKESCLNIEKMDLQEIIDSFLENNRKTIERKQIQISSDPHRSLVFADSKMATRAVFAVLENALKYSPKKGIISISRIIQEGKLALTITDEGRGFSKEQIVKLPFMSSGEHIDQNMCMSLYLVKLIMESHQGSFRYGNNQGKGAWIKLMFPIMASANVWL